MVANRVLNDNLNISVVFKMAVINHKQDLTPPSE